MHCRACDCMLTDEEATNKDLDTGEYQDMCDSCLGIVDADLNNEDMPEELSGESINYETVDDGQD